LMTMDYGSATATNCTLDATGECAMGLSAVQAAKNLNAAYNVPYSQIEITPMIGGNDTPKETFTLEDISILSTFVRANGVGGVHHWSLDRDKDCSQTTASPICNSYGKGGVLGFTKGFQTALGIK
jgi:chitinase